MKVMRPLELIGSMGRPIKHWSVQIQHCSIIIQNKWAQLLGRNMKQCGICKGLLDKKNLYSPNKASKDLRHIWIVSSRLWDGNTQFSIAHGPKGTDPSSTNPDDERKPHGACMLQHSFRWNEYPRANDVTWGDEQQCGFYTVL